MMDNYQICLRCGEVEGIGQWGESCLHGLAHEWATARVADCPYMERTAAGNVTIARRRRADELCSQDERVHDTHHYGDLQRRHFRAWVSPLEAAGV